MKMERVYCLLCIMSYFVYVLYSEKLDRHYTGSTSNIDVRLDFHKNAAVNKFTYKANDWKLVFSLGCDNKTQMLAIERHIKSMKSKTYIQNLIQYPEMGLKLKTRYVGQSI